MSMHTPVVSVVVGTLDRVSPLGRLLDSLDKQSLKPIEVLVIDQNGDDRVGNLLRSQRFNFALTHVRFPYERGLSKGRNRGLRLARGDWIVFSDDDCWYPPDFLARGLALAASHGADLLTGRSADATGRTINGRFALRPGPITRRGVWTRQQEWVTLWRATVMRSISGFDEDVGIGGSTPWQAGEGLDAILRALEQGARAWYDPAWTGYHEELPTKTPDDRMIAKGRAYARGLGYVLRRNGFGAWSLGYWICRSAANLLMSVARGDLARTRYFLHQAVGRFEGWTQRLLRLQMPSGFHEGVLGERSSVSIRPQPPSSDNECC